MPIRRFFPLLIFFLFAGWMYSGWPVSREAAIPYYEETVVELSKPLPKLSAQIGSFLAGPYGMFVRENLWKFAGGYALIALLLLIQSGYRNAGLGHMYLVVVGGIIVTVLFFGALWLSVVCREIHEGYTADGVGLFYPIYRRIGFWPRILSFITGVGFPLLMIVAGLTFYVGVPLYLLSVLFLLPGAVWGVCRLTVTLPFLAWHYLHYLFVPHPAERVYKAGMEKHVKLGELAHNVADVMYKYDLKDYEGLPRAWKSKNWQKRLDALNERLHAEDKFMEELIRNLRLKDQLRE